MAWRTALQIDQRIDRNMNKHQASFDFATIFAGRRLEFALGHFRFLDLLYCSPFGWKKAILVRVLDTSAGNP